MPKYEVTVDSPTAGDVDLLLSGTGGGLIHNGTTAVVEMTEEDFKNMKEDKSGVFKVKKAKDDAVAINAAADPWPSDAPVEVTTAPQEASQGGES